MATQTHAEETKKSNNRKINYKVLLAIIFLITLVSAIAYKSFNKDEPDPISIGKLPKNLDESKVTYRFYDINFGKGRVLKKTNSDMADLKMDGKSGAALHRWIMTTVGDCRRPDIRDIWISANSSYTATVPTVSCDTYANGTIHISGNQNLREFLMKNQYADITGKIIGINASGDIVVLVEDPNY